MRSFQLACKSKHDHQQNWCFLFPKFNWLIPLLWVCWRNMYSYFQQQIFEKKMTYLTFKSEQDEIFSTCIQNAACRTFELYGVSPVVWCSAVLNRKSLFYYQGQLSNDWRVALTNYLYGLKGTKLYHSLKYLSMSFFSLVLATRKGRLFPGYYVHGRAQHPLRLLRKNPYSGECHRSTSKSASLHAHLSLKLSCTLHFFFPLLTFSLNGKDFPVSPDIQLVNSHWLCLTATLSETSPIEMVTMSAWKVEVHPFNISCRLVWVLCSLCQCCG